MSVIKDSPELKPKSIETTIDSTLHNENPIQNFTVEKKLKCSNTQIVPNQSNSQPTISRSRQSSLKQMKQSPKLKDETHRLNLMESKSFDGEFVCDSLPADHQEEEGEEEDEEGENKKENPKAGAIIPQKARSKSSTVLNPNIVSLKSIKKLFPSFNLDRLRMAREITEKAIKMNKIFTIQGGYATIRNCLRKRGWVENFFRVTEIVKKHARKNKSDILNSDDDDDGDDDDGIDAEVDVPKVRPWEEEGGLYGIMSRMVRNLPPAFFWVLRRDLIDYRILHKSQMVNHFARSAVFTTKVGLCVNLRNLQWFEETDPNTFFPRCYRLSHEEEKLEFIDDFNFTACMNILKIVVDNYTSWLTMSPQENQKKNVDSDKPAENPPEKLTDGKNTPKRSAHVPALVVHQALRQCDKFLNSKENIDVDMEEHEIRILTNVEWEQLREWYYNLVHHNSVIYDLPLTLVNQCEASIKRLQILCPQFYLDGKNSVWIVKPGAKSRGRGITCYDRLEDILKLVDSHVAKRESKYVIQKYIERPLLIYNCKFDIRQWFLITDWNPLTMWFYRDSYLRFCSKQFTLSKFDESIHLCNNAVQRNYKNGPRAKELPDNNMWTHQQFKEYLRHRSLPNIWDEIIYPGMKKAIICSMFVSQELVDARKGSFELYGADFMLTDDYSPWLIEINSSPSMEASTAITSRLCTRVLEDTIKVVIDRKYDKNCDIGRYEIGYKQAIVNSPPYLCMNMSVEGQAIKKPPTIMKRPIEILQDTKENILPNSHQQPQPQIKKPNNKPITTTEKTIPKICKRILQENPKSVTLSSNTLRTKNPGFSTPNRKLVKSRTYFDSCSTFRFPGESLRPHAEKMKMWSNRVLGISSLGISGAKWLIAGEEALKKNKKIDPKLLRPNRTICYPPNTLEKDLQIPTIETQRLKTNIKGFRDRPKKTLVTPIARIKFPLLTLQIAKEPYPWPLSTQKHI